MLVPLPRARSCPHMIAISACAIVPLAVSACELFPSADQPPPCESGVVGGVSGLAQTYSTTSSGTSAAGSAGTTSGSSRCANSSRSQFGHGKKCAPMSSGVAVCTHAQTGHWGVHRLVTSLSHAVHPARHASSSKSAFHFGHDAFRHLALSRVIWRRLTETRRVRPDACAHEQSGMLPVREVWGALSGRTCPLSAPLCTIGAARER